MDYIEGTMVKLTYTVKDLDTGLLTDPPDTSVTVMDRAGTTRTLTYSNVEINRLDQGKYRAKIDTTGLIGGVVYEIVTTGDNEVRERGIFNVIARVGP